MVHADLAKIEAEIWTGLEEAVSAKSCPWRVFQLATVDREGSPYVRQVVLREVVREERKLLFFTDPRTPKWEQLQTRAEAEILFWDPGRKVQLRCRCEANCHEGDELANAYRQQVPVHFAGDYAAQATPGAVISGPEDGTLLGEQWSFGVVALTVGKMDWLKLDAQGHRRAGFVWQHESWQASWLQP